jgi:hypothetical protein
MSSSSAIARSKGIIKSRKTQAYYIDTLVTRINQRGNGLQDSDIYEAKEYLKAYDYRTIKVTTSSPFTRSCVYVQMTNVRLWKTWLEPRVVAIPPAERMTVVQLSRVMISLRALLKERNKICPLTLEQSSIWPTSQQLFPPVQLELLLVSPEFHMNSSSLHAHCMVLELMPSI